MLPYDPNRLFPPAVVEGSGLPCAEVLVVPPAAAAAARWADPAACTEAFAMVGGVGGGGGGAGAAGALGAKKDMDGPLPVQIFR